MPRLGAGPFPPEAAGLVAAELALKAQLSPEEAAQRAGQAALKAGGAETSGLWGIR